MRFALAIFVLLTIGAFADRVNFVLVNDTKTPVTAFEMKPCTAVEWSGDLLIKGKPLPANEGDPYLCFDDTTSLLWDVKITTAGGVFRFFAINLGQTPLLYFREWEESGIWVLDLARAERPLPDLDEPASDPFEPDESEESCP